MRLKPKRIGNECTLDEYNAYQYLLYYMKCWKETIFLNTYTSYEGIYASYLLEEPEFMIPNREDTFYIQQGKLTQNSSIKIKVTEIEKELLQLHTYVEVTLYIKTPPEPLNIDGTIFELSVEDYHELKQWSLDESHPIPDLRDYSTITLEADYDSKNQVISIPLVDEENNPLIPEKSLINRIVSVQFFFNKKPYIDVANGKANDPDEILIDNEEKLRKLIQYAPEDNTQVIFRLDSTIPKYYLLETITVKKGQNIVLRGGTNQNAIIDGSIAKRSFIVQPGGYLSLKNITCTNNNSKINGLYKKGYGGAILVEHSQILNDQTFGVCEIDSCTFSNNVAESGGAIYSQSAGVYIDNCIFSENNSSNGGAIYYFSKDVVLTCNPVWAIAGQTVKLIVNVKDNEGNKITEGTIDFYEENETTPFTKAIALNSNGEAILNYTIPKTYVKSAINITAVYSGSITTDSDVVKTIIYVKKIEKYSVKITSAPTSCSSEDMITIKAQATNSQNQQTTTPLGLFTITYQSTEKSNSNTSIINTIEPTIQIINKEYVTKLVVPKDVTPSTKLTVNFDLSSTDVECTPAQTTINIIEKTPIPTPNPQKYIYATFVNMVGTSDATEWKNKVSRWKNANITDVYVRVSSYDCGGEDKTLANALTYTKDTNIKVHAVINAFNTVCKSPNWIEPVPTSGRLDVLKSEIDKLVKQGISGICFDYMRYPDGNSTTRKNNVTNTMKILYNYVKSKGTHFIVTTCVMPESVYSPYYGQDYVALNPYCDYLAPMVYKGNYSTNDDWIINVLQGMKKVTGKINIIATIQTYLDDNNPSTLRSVTDLNTTITKITETKIDGVALFLDNRISEYPKSYAKLMEDS